MRRSEDGGATWGPEIFVAEGIHGGGVIVDQRRQGEILLFIHPEHPPRDGATAPRTMYRSADHGKTWKPADANFHEDENGFVPSLHMNEHGVTLLHGPHAGRLIRPARVYRRSADRYSTAIYSDDGGRSWQSSEPLPIQGSGEGALLELSGGEVLYTARRSFFGEGEPYRHQRHYARSEDGGETWGGGFVAFPDAARWPTLPRQGAPRGQLQRSLWHAGRFYASSGQRT